MNPRPRVSRVAAYFVDEFLELLMQVAANLRDVFEQVLFFYDRQIFEPDAAGQRTTAKGGAVLSGRNRGGEMFFRQERPERHSGGDRLGDGDNVGNHSEALEGEYLAGAPEAALDLVENERGLIAGRPASGKRAGILRNIRGCRLRRRWAPARWRRCWH